ncbi:MAG: hypothetical protein KDK71_07285 [Chlamydiia bacterium]|nr:hypothetical protein [Chlamydiia bacterium]
MKELSNLLTSYDISKPEKCYPNASYPIYYGASSSILQKLKGVCNFFFNPHPYYLLVSQNEAQIKATTLSAVVTKTNYYGAWRKAFVYTSILTIAFAILSKNSIGHTFLKTNPLIDRLYAGYFSLFMGGFSIAQIDTLSKITFASYTNDPANTRNKTFCKWSETTPTEPTTKTPIHKKVLPWIAMIGLAYSYFQSPFFSQWSKSCLGIKLSLFILRFFKNNYHFNIEVPGSITDTNQRTWAPFYSTGQPQFPENTNSVDKIPKLLDSQALYTVTSENNTIKVFQTHKTLEVNGNIEQLVASDSYGIWSDNNVYFRINSTFFSCSDYNRNEILTPISNPPLQTIFCKALAHRSYSLDKISPFFNGLKNFKLDTQIIQDHFSQNGLPNEVFLDLSYSKKEFLLLPKQNVFGQINDSPLLVFEHQAQAAQDIYASIKPEELPPKSFIELLLSWNAQLVANPEDQTAPSLYEHMLLNEHDAAELFEIDTFNLSKRDRLLRSIVAISGNRNASTIKKDISDLKPLERVEMIEILLQYDTELASDLIKENANLNAFDNIEWNQYLEPITPKTRRVEQHKALFDVKRVLFQKLLNAVVHKLGYNKYYKVQYIEVSQEQKAFNGKLYVRSFYGEEQTCSGNKQDKNTIKRLPIQLSLFSVILNLPPSYEIIADRYTLTVESNHFESPQKNFPKDLSPEVNDALQLWKQAETKDVDWESVDLEVPTTTSTT